MGEPEWLYIVKTDSPSQGKGVHVQQTIDGALTTIRQYMEKGTPVRVERIIREDTDA